MLPNAAFFIKMALGSILLFSWSDSASAFTKRVKDTKYSDDGNNYETAGGSGGDGDRFNSGSYSSGNSWFGGRSELGGSGSGSGGSSGRYGALSYVATGGEYPRGGIDRARLTCPGSGSFKWVYFGSRSCMSMGGSAEFFNLLDRSFNKCVAAGAKAAGISSNGGNYGGVVQHKGIEGDARHQKTRSLHNVGRAIDIAVIEVNGVRMDHAVASRQAKSGRTGKEYKFFQAFRQCWSSEVRNSSAACKNWPATRAGTVASIGWENKDHQGHMHISLPVCGQRGFNIAAIEYKLQAVETFLALFAVQPVQAAEPEKPDKINVRLASGDVVTGTAEFTGEPVSEPVAITLNIKCADKKTKALESELQVCDYVSFKEDAATKKLILTTSKTEFNEEDGTVACGAHEVKEYENPCAVSEKPAVKEAPQSEVAPKETEASKEASP